MVRPIVGVFKKYDLRFTSWINIFCYLLLNIITIYELRTPKALLFICFVAVKGLTSTDQTSRKPLHKSLPQLTAV